jgi:hypothetical protein
VTEKQKTEEQPTEQKFDANAARELLQEEQANRERACSEAIQQVLRRHGCKTSLPWRKSRLTVASSQYLK